MVMRIKFGFVAALLTGMFLSSGGQADYVPVPRIESNAAALRVVHAVNPRLPKLEEGELKQMLTVMQKTVAEHFGIRVTLEGPIRQSVSSLLDGIPDHIVAAREPVIYDFKSGTGDRVRLIDGYVTTLKEWKTPLADLIAYAKPWLVQPVSDVSYKGLAGALVTTHLTRLGGWRKMLASDGRPMLDKSNANEWVIWDLLGYSNMPFDVVVTNQPVISAEYEDSGLNSALRGGVSAGGTSFSKSGRYKTYSFISTYPFISAAKFPGGTSDITSRQQAIDLAGKYMAHEIGHMLMLLAHPFGNPACVMRPEPLFRFAAWAKNLDAGKCRVGSSPAMTPGAAQIQFRSDW
jgi:hypothetical protein